jgi:hypothetical protein
MEYRVLRPHDGDKFYNIGDTREGNESELKHLVPLTLEPITEAKAEKAPLNKAVKAAPKNKGG